MKLVEMAQVYEANNELIHRRLQELRLAEQASENPEERARLRRRIADLTPIYREGRRIAILMGRYYSGRRRRYDEH